MFRKGSFRASYLYFQWCRSFHEVAETVIVQPKAHEQLPLGLPEDLLSSMCRAKPAGGWRGAAAT